MLPYNLDFYGKRIRQFAEQVKVPQGAPLNMAPVVASAAAFEAAGRKFDARLAERLRAGNLSPALARKINEQIMQIDRN